MHVIAVDGPAGSGKSSVCRAVADRIGARYLDTGAMYRAMAWAMIDGGIDTTDAAAMAAAAASIEIHSGTDPLSPTIQVGTTDVSAPIRGEEVTSAVSAVSAVPAVRERLVALQRQEVATARAGGDSIVVEGRDITTVVLPDADLKIFITADPAVRALRRAKQDTEQGSGTGDVKATEAALIERDRKDSSRATSPLSQAEDAVVVDTTHLNLDEVIDQVCGLIAALPR